MNKIEILKSQRSRHLSDAQLLLMAGLTSSDLKTKYQDLISSADAAEDEIRMHERLNELDPQLEQRTAPRIEITERPEQRKHRVNAAARTFFRHGAAGLNAEQRALLTTSDASGSALISQSFDDAFVEASKFFGPIFNLVHRKDSETGEPVKAVVSDSTNQTFSLLTEGTTAGSSVAQQPTVLSHIKGRDTLVSSIVYSIQELSDSFDLNAFLMRIAGAAVSRAREMAITVGTTNDGTNTVLPNASGGLLSNVSTGASTSSLAAGIGYSDLVALAGSVDHAYYVNGAYMASPSVHNYLLGQKDSTSRPYYNVDPQTGLLMINGKPLYVNAAMPAYNAASSPVVLFGDYSKSWNVQNSGVSIKVITNDEGGPSLSFLTREMIIWTRLGQSAGLSSAVKALVTAAS